MRSRIVVFPLILLTLCPGCKTLAQTRAERILAELRNPKSSYVLVMAHRADWRNQPENSIPAIESAIKMGADIVEIDVQRTLDGRLVVCHDPTIDRTTSGTGVIAEMPLDSIRKYCLRAGNNIRKKTLFMPTLEEVLDCCKDRILVNIDRGFSYYEQILPMVLERGMKDQVLLNGKATPDRLEKIYSRHDENLMYVPIMNYAAGNWPVLESHFERFISASEPFFAFEVCWNGSVDGVEQLFTRIKQAGSYLWINTLWPSMCGGVAAGLDDDCAFDDPAGVYGKVLEYDPDIILTERPQLIIDYLNSIGRHALH